MRGFEQLIGLKRIKPKVWTIEGTCVYEAAMLARATLEVLNDSIPKIGLLPAKDQLGLYLSARDWRSCDFISNAKFMCAYPMARYLHNDLPKRPAMFTGNPFIFVGKIRKILKNRLVSYNSKNTLLWAGYLQGIKRGCAPADGLFIFEAMLKHKAALSQVHLFGKEIDIESVEELRPYFASMFWWFKEPKPRLMEASTSASFQSTRSEGGARGYIREKEGSLSGKDEMLRIVEQNDRSTFEVRGVPQPSFSSMLLKASKAPIEAVVSAVLEPLKVRLITKADAYRQWVSRFYQRALWKYLKLFPQFTLIARPIEIEDLKSMADKTRELNLPFTFFVSGDYSAATDGIKILYTRMAFEASLEKCVGYSDRLLDVLRSVLYEQEINYPNKFVKYGGLLPFHQTSGQLMGSVLSFPILCVINLVAYWRSLEEYTGRRFVPLELPVLINGDDILFMSNPDHYKIWLKCIDTVGFSLSLGKNYISDKILTINSEFFEIHLVNDSYRFKRIGYLNTGLLTGQSKITGRDSAKLAPIWDQWNWICFDCANPERTLRRFIHYRKKEILKLTDMGQYNMFLPHHRGGLGMWCVGEVNVTNFQRRFATFLENKFKDQVTKGQTPSGACLGIVRTDVFQPELPKVGFRKPDLIMVQIHEFNAEDADYVVFEDIPYKLPLLSTDIPSEVGTWRVRFPRTLKEFRSQRQNRMGDSEIYAWPWILCRRLTKFEEKVEIDVPNPWEMSNLYLSTPLSNVPSSRQLH
jgi:hypothetical protein